LGGLLIGLSQATSLFTRSLSPGTQNFFLPPTCQSMLLSMFELSCSGNLRCAASKKLAQEGDTVPCSLNLFISPHKLSQYFLLFLLIPFSVEISIFQKLINGEEGAASFETTIKSDNIFDGHQCLLKRFHSGFLCEVRVV
jgi:hypothetical protein